MLDSWLPTCTSLTPWTTSSCDDLSPRPHPHQHPTSHLRAKPPQRSTCQANPHQSASDNPCLVVPCHLDRPIPLRPLRPSLTCQATAPPAPSHLTCLPSPFHERHAHPYPSSPTRTDDPIPASSGPSRPPEPLPATPYRQPTPPRPSLTTPPTPDLLRLPLPHSSGPTRPTSDRPCLTGNRPTSTTRSGPSPGPPRLPVPTLRDPCRPFAPAQVHPTTPTQPHLSRLPPPGLPTPDAPPTTPACSSRPAVDYPCHCSPVHIRLAISHLAAMTTLPASGRTDPSPYRHATAGHSRALPTCPRCPSPPVPADKPTQPVPALCDKPRLAIPIPTCSMHPAPDRRATSGRITPPPSD